MELIARGLVRIANITSTQDKSTYHALSKSLPATLFACFAVMLGICGVGVAGCGGRTNSPSKPIRKKKIEKQYQELLGQWKKYDIEKAIISSKLQASNTTTDELDLNSLDEEAKTLRALLDMCYEYAYRPENFSRSQLATRSKGLVEAAEGYKKSYPLWEGRAEPLESERDFRRERDALIDELQTFAKLLVGAHD